MKKIFFSSVKILLALALMASAGAAPLGVRAGEENEPVMTQDGFGFDRVNDLARESGYSPDNELSLEERISSFIGIFLSFLGVIFMLLMLYGGFNWMTAAGDEKKIEKAKNTIRSAVIGLIIVLAAYAISVFVVSQLWGATTTTTNP